MSKSAGSDYPEPAPESRRLFSGGSSSYPEVPMGFSCENHRDLLTHAFMERSSLAARDPISKTTMPLFDTRPGEAGVCATGVLLAVRERHFILTAAHIFDAHHWNQNPIPICVTDGVRGNQLFPIGEVTARRSPTKNPVNRLADDPFDSCVLDISENTGKRIAAGGFFRFLELSELDPWSAQDPRDWFTVAGFPGELNEELPDTSVLGSRLCPFTTFLYMGERGNIRWTDADKGVGILMDYGQHSVQNDAGLFIAPPHPCGMSGGGMWRIAQHGCDIAKWSLADLRLIGIQSAYYTDYFVLRGTRIEHPLGMIYRGHKALRLEFDRHFGPRAKRWLD